MSLPKVLSNRSNKDVGYHAGISGFDRANLVLKEIESFLEGELAETPQLSASFDNVMRPKRKRGPFLIKDISKNKTRRTLNDMVYDPVLQVWVGNSEVLKGFSGAHPQLITSKSRLTKPKVHGQMVFDPVAQKWIGNDTELKGFEMRSVPLIKGTGLAAFKEMNGMTFDPIKMVWVGGYDDLPDFGFSDSTIQKDDGFIVGTEFQLDAAVKGQYTECANQHKMNTFGWWRDDKITSHLFAIRSMSIMRVVRDVKRVVPVYDEEPSFMDIVEKESPHKASRDPEMDLDESWDDLGPFDGTAKVKLRDDESVDDIDAELAKLSKDDKERKFASIPNRSGKIVVDENWDSDFAELDKSLRVKAGNYKPIPSFTNDLPSPPFPATGPSPNPTNTNGNYKGTVTQLGKGGVPISKKPFELLKSDAPHRRSFHLLPGRENSLPKMAWGDEDESGLEIPADEPLQLKRSDNITDDLSSLDEEDGTSSSDVGMPMNADMDDTPTIVEDDDWDDVALPTALGEPVTKKRPSISEPPVPKVEEWDDLDIPEGKVLQPKNHNRHSRTYKNLRDDENEDLDIPENFQWESRLKKRF